ncbi:MAG: hypothetical protein EOO12_14545 [Chitinophagaceae bacterium]|nr:MAG: hypothetical protein EOO12_14545 [Chitinophagaceae bacterium]
MFLLALLGLFLGCKKERSGTDLTEQEELQIALAAVRGDAQASFAREEVFDNVLGVNTDVGIGGTGIFGRRLSPDSLACVTITLQHLGSGAFPLRVTLDFGSGCTARDGRNRSGRIIIEYTGRLTEPGAQATTTFDNYHIDSLAISGTHLLQNVTPPGTGPVSGRRYLITVTDGRIERPNGSYVQWSGQRQIQQTEGFATPHPSDDVFSVTGAATGTLRTGNLISTWTSRIESPLRKSFDCRWIRQGTVRTHRGLGSGGGRWDGLLDYGGGICDNSATLTLNNSTYQISLP